MIETLAIATFVAGFAANAAATTQPPAVSLHRYASTDRSYGANAYWLESDAGIVLIDALFLRPDAELLATLLASRQKPLAGILLTHPHVDHFGGLGTLRRHFPQVPIFATAGTAAGVRPTHDRAFADGWIQAFGADYDPDVVVPERIVADGETLTLANMKFTVRTFGPMEAADNAVVFNHELGVVFAGDALVNGGVYYLGEGRSATTISGLEALAAAYPPGTVALPGHSDPGSLHLIAEDNLGQVQAMRRAVEAAARRPNARDDKGALRDVVRARLLGSLSERLKGKLAYGMSVETIVLMNLAGLERELLSAGAP